MAVEQGIHGNSETASTTEGCSIDARETTVEVNAKNTEPLCILSVEADISMFCAAFAGLKNQTARPSA